MATKIQLRRDTVANWETNNPVLASGEMGVETEAGSSKAKVKIGDGSSEWNDLEYFGGSGSSGSGSSPVVKVFARVEGEVTMPHGFWSGAPSGFIMWLPGAEVPGVYVTNGTTTPTAAITGNWEVDTIVHVGQHFDDFASLQTLEGEAGATFVMGAGTSVSAAPSNDSDAIAPTLLSPPSIGTYVLTATDGVLSWVTA